MENYLKPVVLLFVISLLLFNCQRSVFEDNFVENDYYKIVSIDQVPEIKLMLKNSIAMVEQSNFSNNESDSGSSDLKVNTEKIIAITKNGSTNYTFGIDTDFKNSGYIENLHFIKVERGYIAYIMRYVPDEGWKDDDSNRSPDGGDLVFNPTNFSGYKTKYTLERQVVWTTNLTLLTNGYRGVACIHTAVKWCENGNLHIAGAGCVGHEGEFLYTSERVCEEVDYSYDAGSNGDGGGYIYGSGGENNGNPP